MPWGSCVWTLRLNGASSPFEQIVCPPALVPKVVLGCGWTCESALWWQYIDSLCALDVPRCLAGSNSVVVVGPAAAVVAHHLSITAAHVCRFWGHAPCPCNALLLILQVSWDWQLENTVVFRGTQYLDHYLAAHAVPALSKFQMLAISCLRMALKHSGRLADREKQRLPCKHWAEVTDGACSEAEVRSTCTKLERMLQRQQRSHPSAKQRLRYLWYRLHDAGTVKQEEVYVYMLASFLLHLSLLDSQLSGVLPTQLATAALSLALQVFGLEPNPQVLTEHCFYLQHELQEVQDQLCRAQVSGHGDAWVSGTPMLAATGWRLDCWCWRLLWCPCAM